MVKKYDNILMFNDLHAPAMHKDAIKFLKAVDKEYGPFDKVVCNGDLFDFHACAQWDRNRFLPDSPFEIEEAIKAIQPLFKLFPKVDMTWGNHDLRVMKKAAKEGISTRFLKGLLEAVGAPKGWNLEKYYNVPTKAGTIKFIHDLGCRNVKKVISVKGMNVAQGHLHTMFEIQYVANEHALNWGVTGGCLIDHSHPAYDYSRTSSGTERLFKPVIGCTIIIDGIPHLIPMKLNKRGRWIKTL